MFHNALADLTKYFTQTQKPKQVISETDSRSSSFVVLPDLSNSIKIVRGVLSCLRTHRELVVQECVKDFETKFSQFLRVVSDNMNLPMEQQ